MITDIDGIDRVLSAAHRLVFAMIVMNDSGSDWSWERHDARSLIGKSFAG